MPTYDYFCDQCDYRFEAFQSITSPPISKCPRCDSSSVRRLIGGGNGFLFKGNGFYATDYRSDSYKKDKEKSESTVAKSASEKSAPPNKTDTASNSLTQNSAKTAEQ